MEKYLKKSTNTKTITCLCGKVCNENQSFSVYEKRFCSMECLRPYKKIIGAKKKPVADTSKHMTSSSYDFGGSGCC